ncbi:hypothetical protein SAMN02745166_00897 [Prosthecobacter debontii]|uniref:Uncharacterized protein n=1 Tax=Prosthecobacter debontii TaxID=48467 RepID=A0A1T4WYC3_9BACT|nr:hypothetical protein [Prosthecobacter debontii]SKA82350.1 hypothetical protein SAMN02745166_00897 [Prosthecobacter debontii]
MLNITDPCELKAADIYRQAQTVASKTSRGTDGHWYKVPEELPWQWHLWFDGGREVCSATFSKQHHLWRPGPVLPLANLTTGEGVSEVLGELMSSQYFKDPPKALGVILHVADEFSLAEISQTGETSGETAEDFQILRYNLVDDPREVLADREVSTEANSWRLLPFNGASAGQARCAAVTLSRARESFLQHLLACAEGLRMPVRVAVTSAAVESLAAIPLLKPDLAGGCLIAFSFYKFTAVFALGANGELQTARSLAHRGGSSVPTGFGDILWNMALGAELDTPKVLLVSAQPQVLQSTSQELELYSLSRQPIQFETLSLSEHPALTDIPGHRPEFLTYDGTAIEQLRTGQSPLTQTETFRSLWSTWARQSFMDTGKLDNLYPTQRDLRLLRFSSWLIYLMVFSLITTSGYGTYALFSAMNHPSWNLTPEDMQKTQAKHNLLLEEKRQIDITSRLLQPRSSGWVTLEFILQLFPEDSGVRLENFQYSAEAARQIATSRKSKGKGPKADAVGITRTWTLKGLVKPKALELLNTLNSQRGLSSFFDRIADTTGDESYRTSPTRQLTVSLTQSRNPRFNAEAAPGDLSRDATLAFPFNFEAIITQTMSEKDPLAMPLDKPF